MSLQEFVSTMAPLIDLEKVSSPALFSSSPLAPSELGMGLSAVWCAGGGDIVGVGGELQEDGEERLRHAQPQVHRCPGWWFGSIAGRCAHIGHGANLALAFGG
jgi:hypothetical protein